MQVFFGGIKATAEQAFSKHVPVSIEDSLLHGDSLEQFKSKKYTFESINALVPDCTSLEDGVEKLARCYERILNRLAYMSHHHSQFQGNQTISINLLLGEKKRHSSLNKKLLDINQKLLVDLPAKRMPVLLTNQCKRQICLLLICAKNLLIRDVLIYK